MTMKPFVIYGAGSRGKRFFSYIGEDYVAAFIDQNAIKQNYTYCGKPVISLNDYIKEYSNHFIIQSINSVESISGILDDNGIVQYSELSRLPGEFSGWGTFDYKVVFAKQFYKHKTVYLYGVNALSLLAVDYCNENKIKAKIIIDAEDIAVKNWLIENTDVSVAQLSEIADLDDVFITEERDEERIHLRKTSSLYNFKPFFNGFYENIKLKPLKGCRKNEKCFIIATGPSLRVEDLNVLKDKEIFSFGVNSIIKIKNDWIPDAYVCVDTEYLIENIDEINQLPVEYKFISDVDVSLSLDKVKSYNILHCIPNDYGIMPSFEEDISMQVSFGVTVTFVALQIAVYMGFSEIYLLGVDCNYLKGSRNNHFIEDDKGDHRDHYIDGMMLNYQSAKNYADAHGIKIYNATRGGMLEVFERVDFDSLF